MTASPHIAGLTARLAELRAERDLVEADLPAPSGGDEADRATNVDGHAHLSALEDRIAAAESALAAASVSHPTGVVSIGSVVGLDFGDGTEPFLVAAADPGDPNLTVVTPASPLGKALIGAKVGAKITYEVRQGKPLAVTVTQIS